MKSTTDLPLAIFDWYLENEIYKDLKEFYIHITEELYFNSFEILDKDNHIVKVLNIYDEGKTESKYITFSFEGNIKAKLKKEIKQTKQFLELGFQERFSSKKKLKRMLIF